MSNSLTYPRIDVTAANGVPFTVVYVPADAPYPNHPAATRLSDVPLVEFYDARYRHTDDGQFTGGRYYAATIAEGRDAALVLDSGSPSWRIDRDTMRHVRGWLAGLAG